MYRFLLTPRWVGLAALTLVLAAVMVLLGNWQLDRYRLRSAINDRIDAAATAPPVPLTQVLPAGAAPQDGAAWTRVQATGRYDRTHEILARGRTVDGRVGFEVVTPLVLADGSALLVDRGWLPPPRTGVPPVPPAPAGEVTVVGRVHLSESRPGPMERRDGFISVRRIAVPQLAGALPYPVVGAYLLLDSQVPPAGADLTAVPSRRENAWQNGGYVVQWWMLAALTIAVFGWLVRRQARGPADPDEPDTLDDPHDAAESAPTVAQAPTSSTRTA